MAHHGRALADGSKQRPSRPLAGAPFAIHEAETLRTKMLLPAVSNHTNLAVLQITWV